MNHSILKMFFSKTFVKILGGCCTSAFLMEILMTWASFCAVLITFVQFLFIALYGFIFTTKFLRVERKIPVKQYGLLVGLFFVTSVANNYVYYLHVPSTLHMIIRSASSPASMLVYWYAKRTPPKINKVIGSVLITLGVCIATYSGATIAEQKHGMFLYWCLGVAILIVNLFLGAFTGLRQEKIYSMYGKHPEEVLFYTNALALPFFLFTYPQIRDAALGSSWAVWSLILISVVPQYICTQAVYELATKENTVTVTFVLTVRKFLSLLISSIVFKNNVTFLHVIGTVFVMVGTYVYFDYFSNSEKKPVSMKDK